MITISVNNVSIKYQTSDLENLGLKEWVMRKIREENHTREFWALSGITFSLEKGDFLGIIGGNGAGKSTLSKVIAGILEPTDGFIEVNGKIASIISMGAGFDGNLTISENVYLRGAYLGLSKKYILKMHDEIIKFADLWDYKDQPFRVLSSGMRSKLGVSITTLIEPEILILDEAFAGGDETFKKKAQDRMMSMIGKGETTTIFVSHSMGLIQQLATKVLWLDKGRQIAVGEPKEIISMYTEFSKEIAQKK